MRYINLRLTYLLKPKVGTYVDIYKRPSAAVAGSVVCRFLSTISAISSASLHV